MLAKDVLEWICKSSINGEFLNLIDIPEKEEQTEEWWIDTFGGLPAHVIPEGKYLYFYTSQIDYFDFEPDAEIELCNTGTMHDYDYINLIKIDD